MKHEERTVYLTGESGPTRHAGPSLQQRRAATDALMELVGKRCSVQQRLLGIVKLLRDLCDCPGAGIMMTGVPRPRPFTAQAGFSRQFLSELSRSWQQTAANGQLAQSSSSPELARACSAAGYQSMASVPIRCGEAKLAIIILVDRRPRKFLPEAIELIQSLGPLIGLTLLHCRVEETLERTHQRLHSMFESNHAMMLFVDSRSNVIVDANLEAAKFFGYPPARLCGMKLQALGMKRTARRWVGQRASTEGQDYFETAVELSNGKVRMVEVRLSPVSQPGRALHLLILHDTTERKLLQRQLLSLCENERRRVGRDLHDALGGTLTGVTLLARALCELLAQRKVPEVALAEEIMQGLNNAISRTRSIARGLCPIELDKSGLTDALQDLAADVQGIFGVACQFQYEPSIKIKDELIASHLFRIAQEAVTNAIRHGKPRTITISLSKASEQIALKIENDGRSFPKLVLRKHGLGLRTMRFRADVLDADLEIGRGEGGGTRIVCLLPLHAIKEQGGRRPQLQKP